MSQHPPFSLPDSAPVQLDGFSLTLALPDALATCDTTNCDNRTVSNLAMAAKSALEAHLAATIEKARAAQ